MALRPRPSTPLPLLVLTCGALLSLAPAARAEVKGPDGYSLGEALPGASAGVLFVHPEKKQWLQRLWNQLDCGGPDVLTPGSLNDPTYGGHGLQGTARAGDEHFYAFAWGYDALPGSQGGESPEGFAVYRAVCGVNSEQVLALPPGAAGMPPALDKTFAGGVPAAPDGTVYLPTQDGFYTLSLDAPAPPTPLATRAAIQAAFAAFPDPYPWTDAPVVEPFYLASATVDGAGRLLVVVAQPIDGETATWLVRVDPDKVVHVIAEPAVTRAAGVKPAPIAWSPTLGATLLDCGSRLCVVDSDGAALRAPHPPWLARSTMEVSIGNLVPTTGEPFVQMDVDFALRPLLFDPARLDADRDGLPLAREISLGLSDLDPDGDDDGVHDGTEVRLFATDPSDPASGPPRVSSAPKLAPSMRMHDWTLFRDRMIEVHGLHIRGVWPGAVCHRVENMSGFRCLKGDGAPVRSTNFDYGTSPDFNAGLGYALLGNRVVDVATGAETVTAGKPDTAHDPGFGATTYQRVDDDRRVMRYRDGGAFAVIDLDRTGCPILGSAEEEATRCSDPAEEMLDIHYVSLAGYHAPTQSNLFALHTHTRGVWLVAINDTRAERVAHLQTFDDRSPYFAPLADGAVTLGMFAEDNGENGVLYNFDPGFRTIGEPFGQKSMTPHAGAWFRHGMLHVTSYAWYTLPPDTGDESGGCVSVGDLTLCGFDSPVAMPDYTSQVYVYHEWVPVPEKLEPGEALFFANLRNVEGGTFVTKSEADWALWRQTRRGGTYRWIDRPRFESLLDAAGESSIAAEPLGPVVALGAREDGRRVCIVERPASEKTRLFELALDGETAEAPSALTLTAQASASACAYAPGGLAVLAQSGAASELRLPGGETYALSIPDPSGFVAIDGGWLAWGREGETTCVRGGSVQASTTKIVAADFKDGLVHYVDIDGMPYVATLDAICGGEGAQVEALTERVLLENPLSLWTLASQVGSIVLEGHVKRAHLALSPSGHVLYATEGLGYDSASAFYHDRLMRLRPSYTPRRWDARIVELDPRRHEKALHGFDTILAENLTALTVVPWKEWELSDWEYLGMTPPPPWVGGKDPDLTPIPWPDSKGDEDASSCGCRVASSETEGSFAQLLGLVALAGAWARKRRARPVHERSVR
ncbi:hypothetical protein [Polyangium spumosum]|uniref:Rhodanese domain-containing protein n=1 Tax=Polyangium spumosum TaxID=889282 RepID=A0A6N7PTV6_9BACT|nr:hypothetical protein [Polyangium spumosum]MRG95349.1 hypothetical protein [Polyangium spumosum]